MIKKYFSFKTHTKAAQICKPELTVPDSEPGLGPLERRRLPCRPEVGSTRSGRCQGQRWSSHHFRTRLGAWFSEGLDLHRLKPCQQPWKPGQNKRFTIRIVC